MYSTQEANNNTHNWVNHFNKCTCSVQIQHLNDVNTIFNIQQVLNILDLSMSWYNVCDWDAQIKQYDAPPGCGRKWMYKCFKQIYYWTS